MTPGSGQGFLYIIGRDHIIHMVKNVYFFLKYNVLYSNTWIRLNEYINKVMMTREWSNYQNYNFSDSGAGVLVL